MPACSIAPKETPPMKEKNTEREWESSPTWDELEAFARQGVRRPRARALRAPRLVIGDGHPGIWGAVATVFPTAAEAERQKRAYQG